MSGILGSKGASSPNFEGALSNSCGFKNGSTGGHEGRESSVAYSMFLGMIAGDPITVGRDSKQLLHSHWSQAFSLSGIRGLWQSAWYASEQTLHTVNIPCKQNGNQQLLSLDLINLDLI